MGSTFSGIELGKRSLFAHNQGLQTTGHNLGNASTEGYSRQRVKMKTVDPLYAPQLNRENTPGQIGQGVEVASIERIRDNLLENRIIAQGDNVGYWKTRDDYILMLEQIYNEPDDMSLRSLMDSYWEGWQELSVHPEEMAARQAVLQRGQALMDGINERFTRLDETREMVNDDVQISVGEVNGILKEIGELNTEIAKSRALGDNPNDLLDRRDMLVENLSGFLKISVDHRDSDEFQIHTGGVHLIQGDQTFFLDTVPNNNNEGMSDVVWEHNGQPVQLWGGKIASLVELRDVDIRQEIQQLDTMALNLTDKVNDLHRRASGLNNETGNDFFVEVPFVNNLSGNYDSTGDGNYDSTYIHRISGIHSLNPQDHIGIQGTLSLAGPEGNIQIDYYPADTVEDVIGRINGTTAEIKAQLDHAGHLVLTGTASQDNQNPDFVIRYMEDSGEFLAGYSGILSGTGPDNSYSWEQADAVLGLRDGGVQFAVAPTSHPSAWMSINSELRNNPAAIAAGFTRNGEPAESGDGSAALAIAGLRTKQVMIGPLSTFDDYFVHSVANIGLKGEIAGQTVETQHLVMKDLKDFQQSISGVNVDEEMAEMIKFQHGYTAAARFITEVDKMLDTIINRMGV